MGKKFTYNFIRFGSLSQMNQLTYGNGTYHSPPKKKGIYAFPEGLVDRFLLTATNDPRNESHKSYWLKDKNGERINSVKFWDEHWNDKMSSYGIHKKYKSLIKKKKIRIKDIFEFSDYKLGEKPKWYICVYKKPKKFNYEGEIWCHLDIHLKPEHIIEVNGSWVKVTMEDYIFAFNKERHELRKGMIKMCGTDWKEYDPFKFFSTDHLEVFIEKIN